MGFLSSWRKSTWRSVFSFQVQFVLVSLPFASVSPSSEKRARNRQLHHGAFQVNFGHKVFCYKSYLLNLVAFGESISAQCVPLPHHAHEICPIVIHLSFAKFHYFTSVAKDILLFHFFQPMVQAPTTHHPCQEWSHLCLLSHKMLFLSLNWMVCNKDFFILFHMFAFFEYLFNIFIHIVVHLCCAILIPTIFNITCRF